MPSAKKTPQPAATPAEPTEVFIVNRAGAVHDIDPATTADVLKRPGYRRATEGEIVAYRAASVQDSTDPIGKRGL
jgi:hypothetical protein